MQAMVETSIEYMINLDWNNQDLNDSKKMLSDWDKRKDSFYKNKLSMKFDKAEREHLRNCINFWENRLNNEAK